MAVSSAQLSVGSTAVALNTDTDTLAGTKLVVKSLSAAADVFLGDSGVTSANGFQVAAGATVTVELAGGEQLFAVGPATPVDVHVLRTGA